MTERSKMTGIEAEKNISKIVVESYHQKLLKHLKFRSLTTIIWIYLNACLIFSKYALTFHNIPGWTIPKGNDIKTFTVISNMIIFNYPKLVIKKNYLNLFNYISDVTYNTKFNLN